MCVVIENMCDILKSEGVDLLNFVEILVFFVNMSDFGGYNEVYVEYFDELGFVWMIVVVY